ncbi:MAG: hypothetical protein JWP63_4915 [Candidatus Solibacter sp.]|nr:hypothetical protein [Candidatus Solibacter sp.]
MTIRTNVKRGSVMKGQTSLKNASRRFVMMLTIGFGLFIPTNIVAADEQTSLQQLTAQWWQWAISIPTPQNPILDQKGESCMVGQRGSVWFLAGLQNGGTVKRTCTVPAGTTLFFPVVNAMEFNSPCTCGQNNKNLPVSTLRADTAGFIDTVTDFRADLGSTPIYVQRVKSDVFAVALPEENILVPFGRCAPGIYSPSVDDGQYAKLDPLTAGNYTLHIHAAATETTFRLDVTYNLKVVPVVLR